MGDLTLANQLAGRRLGDRYRLDQLLATGGMAHVWRATDTVLDRTVAVKILHEHLAGDPVFVERFRHEAVAVARLNHPAIVAVYDTVTDAGLEALVLQYVPGPSLRHHLDDRGPLAVPEAGTIVAATAEALHEAHRQGIVHRDVKPSNLLLAPPGSDHPVLVADFGIAKAASSADLTATGTLLGTAGYLSPEQVRGEPADGRSDIYALTTVLYESLSGRLPFDGANDMAVAMARLQRDPHPIGRLVPHLGPDLLAVVDRGLARDPGARYDDVLSFRRALLGAVDRADDHHGDDITLVLGDGAAPSFTESERTWLVPTVIVLLVALALALAGALLGGTDTGARLIEQAREAIGDSGPAGTEPTAPVPASIQSIRSHDPQGVGAPAGEHEDLVAAAVDGDPSTVWTTESYSTPAFGNLKEGVGLVVGLDRSVALDGLSLTSDSVDWDGAVYVADDDHDDIDGWGGPVTTFSGFTDPTTIDLDGAEGRYLLLWITALDPTISPHRVELAEVVVHQS